MAFTNTGFAPNDGGVAVFADDYLVLSLLMVGVFLGSIGFPSSTPSPSTSGM